MVTDPKIEIPYQVDRLPLVQLAGAMLLVQELCNKFVADHWQKVGIAHSGIFSLGSYKNRWEIKLRYSKTGQARV